MLPRRLEFDLRPEMHLFRPSWTRFCTTKGLMRARRAQGTWQIRARHAWHAMPLQKAGPVCKWLLCHPLNIEVCAATAPYHTHTNLTPAPTPNRIHTKLTPVFTTNHPAVLRPTSTFCFNTRIALQFSLGFPACLHYQLHYSFSLSALFSTHPCTHTQPLCCSLHTSKSLFLFP